MKLRPPDGVNTRRVLGAAHFASGGTVERGAVERRPETPGRSPELYRR
jgi:hypothetical protein